jgi:hypothetical protein
MPAGQRGREVTDREKQVAIEEWSAKAREGGPAGPLDSDDGVPGTRRVVSL